MLNGEFVFIRAERIEGISSKTNKPYDIGKLTVSDGLESFDMDINPNLVPMLGHITKGDKVKLNVEVTPGFRGTNYQVNKVDILQTAK